MDSFNFLIFILRFAFKYKTKKSTPNEKHTLNNIKTKICI